jgi:putative flippase GtrA
MVEAGTHEAVVVRHHPMALEDRVDEREVRGEGHDRRMHERVSGDRPGGAHPQLLTFGGLPAPMPRVFTHEAEVEAVGLGETARELLLRAELGNGHERFRVGDIGDRLAMGETFFFFVKRTREGEDRLSVLDPGDVAGGERVPVSQPLHLVEDREMRIPRTQEVRVQRVDLPALDGAAGGDERLRGDLTPEHAAALFVEAHTSKDVHLDLLEIEQLDEVRPLAVHVQTVHLGIMRKAMKHPVAFAREYVRSAHFRRFLRYSSVSVVSTIISLSGLYIFFRVLHIGTATDSNLLATAVASVPAYYLNRTWAWGKSGRSHVFKEVVPFWVITILGVALSTTAVHFAAVEAKSHHLQKDSVTLAVEFANFFTYGVLWFAKFSFFNRVLFKVKTEDTEVVASAPVSDVVMTGTVIAASHNGDGAPVAPAPAIETAARAADSDRLSEVELA